MSTQLVFKVGAFVVGVGLALGSLVAHGAEKRLDRTFDVTPGGLLTVESDGTNVVVQGGEGNRVVVHIVLKGSQSTLDRMEVDATQSGADVRVTAKKSSHWFDWLSFSWSLGGEIRVEVPRSYNAQIKTSGGDVSLARLEGKAEGRTSGGDVHAADIRGPLTLHTSGGDVTATGIEGDTELSTSGGEVRAVVNGKIDARTSGGDVTLELVGANRGISAHTSGGSVVLRLPKATAATVTARTSGGSIHSDLPVAATDLSERSLRGSINGGGSSIDAHTSGGDIRLQASN
jgi:DUF4097 and DUF4098 domain-containing protein YvlB